MIINESYKEITLTEEDKDSKALKMFVQAKIEEIKAFSLISENDN